MKRKTAEPSDSKGVNAKYWIKKLRLEPHPEGGYFRQTYKSELIVPLPASGNIRAIDFHPPAENAGRVGQATGTPELVRARAASTAIYFLLDGGNFSAFHRLRSDEMWHFYAGSPLIVHVIEAAGEYSSILLGNDADAGQRFQAVVKAGCWFASEIEHSHFSQRRREVGHASYALVGCTVAPGFEFEDFELAKREELAGKFPRHRELIERLTRE